MKKSLLSLLALVAIAATAFSGASFGQTYPTTSPVYQPNAQLAAQTQSVTGTTTPFTVQGVGTLTLRVSGTNTGAVAAVQGTNDVIGGTQTWTTLNVYPVAGQSMAPKRSITGNGVYRINAAGLTQVRVNLTSLSTGTFISRFVGAPIALVPSPEAIDLGALSTFTSQAAATVTVSDIINVNNKGVYCVYNQTAASGNPSTTFSIQAKDGASGSYISLLTSAAMTSATSMPVTLTVFPGAPVTANVAANAQLPSTWRISTTVGGSSTPIVAGTIGCQVLP